MDNITPTMHCMWSGVHFSYQTEAEAEAEEVEVEVRIHSLLYNIIKYKIYLPKEKYIFYHQLEAGHRSHPRIHGFLRLSNFKFIKSF